MSSMQPLAAPADADARRAVHPVICYPVETLPAADLPLYATARQSLVSEAEIVVPPRDARCFRVPAGSFFRIRCDEGSQVGDLNLWHAGDLSERFYSGKTRALHGTHVSVGDRLWSSFPYLRPMATITHDTLGWYGVDALRRPGARRDRHALRPLHPPAADRRHLPPLLPLEPDPRARGRDRPLAG